MTEGETRSRLRLPVRVRGRTVLASITAGSALWIGAASQGCLPEVDVADPGAGVDARGGVGGDAGRVDPMEPVTPASGPDERDAAGGAAASPMPLTLVGFDPANSSDGVPLEASLRVAFSEPLDPANGSMAAIQLTRSGSVPIAGTVTVEGSALSFMPSEPLVLATDYLLVLRGTVRGGSGTEWSGTAQANFRTREGSWATPLNIAPAGDNPRLALDGKGNALAIWNQVDPGPAGQARLMMARFTPALGWRTLPAAPEACGLECRPKLVAAGSDADFELVWAALGTVNAQRFHPDEGFGVTVRVPDDGDSSVVGAITGKQLWMVADVSSGIVIAQMADGQSWLPLAQPHTSDYRPSHAGPVLILGAPQNARVFWAENSALLVTEFADGMWSRPQPLSTWDSFDEVSALAGAGSARGDVVIVWERDHESVDITGLRESELDLLLVAPDGTIRRGRLNLPEDYIGNSFSPAVSVNATGDALSSWIQSPGNADDANATGRVWASFRASNSPTWSVASSPSTSATVRARPPAIGIDASGSGHAVWVEVDAAGNAQVVASRFLGDRGSFASARVISAGTPVSPALTRGKLAGNDDCRLGVDAQGRGIALWAGAAGIWSARFE
jgi:hypothetical protein